jgi:hypothetical protein
MSVAICGIDKAKTPDVAVLIRACSHDPTARAADAIEGAGALKQEAQRAGWVERSDTHQFRLLM